MSVSVEREQPLLARRCPRWVVGILAIALALAPTAAVAATLYRAHVIGADGRVVAVSNAGEVTTASISPDSLRAFHFNNLLSGSCVQVYTAPKGESFVLTALTVNVFVSTFAGPGVNVRVGTSAGCTDREVAEVADANPGQVGATSFSFDPGIVVTAGRHLYAVADNGTAANVYGYGYVVPSADDVTPTVGAPGPSKVASVGRLP